MATLTFTGIFGSMARLSTDGGLIVSALTTRYRDLAHLVTFGV